MWNALPFGAFFVNSLKLASLNTIGQLISCSMAAFAFAALRFRFRGAALRAPARHADHPVPGRPRPELHPLPAAAPSRSARAATGSGRRSRCGSGRSSAARSGRSCSASSSWRSRASSPTRPASTGRTRGRSTATSTCRWPSRPSRRSRSSRSCGRWNDLIDPIIYLRDVESLTLTAGLSLFQGQYVGQWPLLMAGALVSVIPMIILFIVAQRHFVRGIALTGIKG